MQVGMLDHLRRWIFHFIKTDKLLDRYNVLWLSVPAYHNLTPKYNLYEEFSQRNGKEKKEISQYLLGVVTQSLRCGSHPHCPIFNRAIGCTQPLLEFQMYAQYRSPDDATLHSMPDALHHFHTFKVDFLLG
jgi:hypothetical protein